MLKYAQASQKYEEGGQLKTSMSRSSEGPVIAFQTAEKC